MPNIPLIAAGAALAGQAVSAASVGKQNKKSRQWAAAMYRRQRQDALDDFQMQNEYNSPKAQMQRFKDANLNPHLIYGQGDNGNSFQVRSSDAPTPEFNPTSVDGGSIVSAYQDTAMKKQQTDNLTTQNENLRLQGLLTAAQTVGTQAGTLKTLTDTETGKFNLGYMQETKDMMIKKLINEIDQGAASVDKTKADTKFTLDQNERAAQMQVPQMAKLWQEIKNLKEGVKLSQAQREKIAQEIINLEKDGSLKQYEIELNKQGVQKNDSLIMRKLFTFLQGGSGSIVDQALKLIK